MWAKPPINLPGKTEKKHVDPDAVLCPRCHKSNSVSEADRKVGHITCKGCGREIKVAK